MRLKKLWLWLGALVVLGAAGVSGWFAVMQYWDYCYAHGATQTYMQLQRVDSRAIIGQSRPTYSWKNGMWESELDVTANAAQYSYTYTVAVRSQQIWCSGQVTGTATTKNLPYRVFAADKEAGNE